MIETLIILFGKFDAFAAVIHRSSGINTMRGNNLKIEEYKVDYYSREYFSTNRIGVANISNSLLYYLVKGGGF